MTISTTLAHAALEDMRAALIKVKRMLPRTDDIEWEINKATFLLETWLASATEQEERLDFG